MKRPILFVVVVLCSLAVSGLGNDFSSSQNSTLGLQGALASSDGPPRITSIRFTPEVPVRGQPLRIELIMAGARPFKYEWARGAMGLATTPGPVFEIAVAEVGTYFARIWETRDRWQTIRVAVVDGTPGNSQRYQLQVWKPIGGVIEVDPLLPDYAPGSGVSLTARAEPDFEFVGWQGDLAFAGNPATVLMIGHQAVSALFRGRGGTVDFDNSRHGRILDTDGVTLLDGNRFVAQLYAGTSLETLLPAGEPTRFEVGERAGRLSPSIVVLPNIPPGSTAVVQVRAWELASGETYERAVASDGNYGVSAPLTIVTGSGGDPPSAPAALNGLGTFSLSTPILILHQPAALEAHLGDSATFQIETGGPSTRYEEFQWRKHGVAIPGATLKSLTINPVREEDFGSYSVTIRNARGAVESDSAPLGLSLLPILRTVISSPSPQHRQPLRLEVVVEGGGPFAYEWLCNGNPANGINNQAVYETTSAQSGAYRVRVTGPGGTVSKEAVTLPALFRLARAVEGSGSIVVSPLRDEYLSGTVVRLEGVPADGYAFAEWKEGLTGPINPASLVMDDDKRVVATFLRLGGSIYFANRIGNVGAPIFDVDGLTPLSGDGFSAQLYAGPAPDSLSPVADPRPFRSGAGAGYLLPATVRIPWIVPGAAAFVQVRAWNVSAGSSYEEVLAARGRHGASPIVSVVSGGAGSPPSFPALLVGLESFRLLDPTAVEPLAIKTWSQPLSILAGERARLHVQATGAPPVRYAWFEGRPGDLTRPVGDDAPDFESSPLFVPTHYWVRVSDSTGSADSVGIPVDVTRRAQTLTFEAPDPGTLGGPAIPLRAASSSGLPVVFSIVSGSATIDAGLLAPLAAGEIRVRASQSGDELFLPAIDIERALHVEKGTARVILSQLETIADGTSKHPVVETDPSGLGVTLSYNGLPIPPIAPGDYLVLATITDANYVGSGSATLRLRDPYAVWAAAQQLPQSSTPADDPDGDGLPNLLEFLLGTPPLLGSPEGHPKGILVKAGDSLLAGIELSRTHAAAHLHLLVESSDDLARWTRVEPVVEMLPSGTSDDVVRLLDPTPVMLPPHRFLRLRVEPAL